MLSCHGHSETKPVSKRFFGWDIGGAHLKVALVDDAGDVQAVRQVACPLWRGLSELSRAAALLDMPIDTPNAEHAVTMTGELCDVFANRAEGVRAILGHFATVVGNDARVRVFGGYQGWLSVEDAAGDAVVDVASANWLALSAYTAELAGDAVLIDVGSTTTDIVPMVEGEVRATGRDDLGRMACGELVYTGVVRTPVAATVEQVPFRGRWQPVAAELFATMADVHRLTGQLADRHDLMPTADNRGKDLLASAKRLARMFGHDFDGRNLAEMSALASYVAAAQRRSIESALALVSSRPGLAGLPLVGAGVGRFVVERVARESGRVYRSFEALARSGEVDGDALAISAPAVAAAKLAWMTA